MIDLKFTYGKVLEIALHLIANNTRNLIALCVLLLLLQPGYSQDTFPALEGYWKGAFIKNNSYQSIDISFYKRDGKYYSLQIMEEWHPSFGEFEIEVDFDSASNIVMNTGYGKAVLEVDLMNREMVGKIVDYDPEMYLHLKQAPPPPEGLFTIDPVTIPNGEIRLSGHLHESTITTSKTAIILVGGRGCYADATAYNLYAKFFREYGTSALVYQKRGNGSSTGDCSNATIDELASDVVAVNNYLSGLGKYDKIGVLGNSAGGWVMTRAAEMEDFDFMISIVGPSTSVRDQQLQSMKYGSEFFGLPEEESKHVEEYTLMMFDAKATEKNFKKFQELLEIAEKEDWKKLLEDTDIPGSAEEIANLWVRRNNYDPAESLSKYSNPYLAIYGETDWIVPYKENVERLNELFGERKNRWLTTVVAYGAEHGMEMEGKEISLSKERSYWHFYRNSPEVRIEILNFLRKYNLIYNLISR